MHKRKIETKVLLLFKWQQEDDLSSQSEWTKPVYVNRQILQSKPKTYLKYPSEICLVKGHRLCSLIFWFGFNFLEGLKFWDHPEI